MKKINFLLIVIASSFSLIALGIYDSQKTTSTIISSTTTLPLEDTISPKENMPPLVNYDYFEELVKEVKDHRAKRLVSLDNFLKGSKEYGSVILDTRSKAMYDLKHVKGAIHLNFSDFTQGALNELFASYRGKNTNIYIYCNNNFYDSKALVFQLQDQAFISKAVISEPITEFKLSKENDIIKTLALNIPTYINLYGYGFTNVYELNEFIDVNDPKIEFEGTFNQIK